MRELERQARENALRGGGRGGLRPNLAFSYVCGLRQVAPAFAFWFHSTYYVVIWNFGGLVVGRP